MLPAFYPLSRSLDIRCQAIVQFLLLFFILNFAHSVKDTD